MKLVDFSAKRLDRICALASRLGFEVEEAAQDAARNPVVRYNRAKNAWDVLLRPLIRDKLALLAPPDVAARLRELFPREQGKP